MKFGFRYLFVFLLLPYAGNGKAQNVPEKNPILPAWVDRITPDYNASYPGASQSGYYYLLLDKQVNLENEHRYMHIAIKILNNEGVQDMSDISTGYDPAYQKLVFHQIIVIRAGEVMNRLKLQEIRIVQRETNMDRYLYDGRLTAVLNLTDIRQGDIIEYAYSVNGDNPIFENNFYDKLYFRFEVPLENQYTKLVVPSERSLAFRYSNGASQPKTRRTNGNVTYVWENEKTEAVLIDINTPAWYDPYPSVSVAEHSSWGNLAAMFVKWYTLNNRERQQLERDTKQLFGSSGPDAVAIKAIRFVQDEIRYLAFEDGINSHKPDLPARVLHQRYGDCKAKSFLLCEMLKIYHIDASPVLVHTHKGNVIENDLPSPDAFNHCIVEINLNNKTYYVDPTISNQGGDLEHYYCPDYQKGLVLKKGINAMTAIPFRGYTGTRVTETFYMQEVGKGATLHVLTKYTGGDADRQRSYYKGSDLESIQKEYIDFYSKLYPAIKTAGDIVLTDNREALNEFVVEERYFIDTIWTKSSDNDQLLIAGFYPLSFEACVSGNQSPERTMPYYLDYPVDYEHKTIVKLPEEWTISNDESKMHDESFQYEYLLEYFDNELNVTHSYKALNGSVDADKVKAYIAKHDKIINNLEYTLTYDKNLLNGGYKISWKAALTAFITLVISILIALRVYGKYDIKTYCRPENAMPIGSWLILIGIGFIISPVRILIGLFRTPEFFNSHIWSALTTAYGKENGLLFGALMTFELIYNVAFLVFLLLTIVLFLKRRTLFPNFAVAVLITVFIVNLLDHLAVLGLNPQAFSEEEQQEFYKTIAQNVISAAIWIPYLLLSDRVKRTFVFRAKNKGMLPEESHQLINPGLTL